MEDVRAAAKQKYEAHKKLEERQEPGKQAPFPQAWQPPAETQPKQPLRPANCGAQAATYGALVVPSSSRQAAPVRVEVTPTVAVALVLGFAIILGLGIIFIVFPRFGVLLMLLLLGFAVFLHVRLPSDDTFELFFKKWFQEVHWPKISEQVQQELARRARSQSFFAALALQFQAMVVGATEGLSGMLWYDMWAKQVLPPQYGNYVCFRSAVVNLGTHEAPCPVTFYGANNTWFTVPWSKVDAQCASMLETVANAAGAATATAPAP